MRSNGFLSYGNEEEKYGYGFGLIGLIGLFGLIGLIKPKHEDASGGFLYDRNPFRGYFQHSAA